jgi:hypothetical protein
MEVHVLGIKTNPYFNPLPYQYLIIKTVFGNFMTWILLEIHCLLKGAIVLNSNDFVFTLYLWQPPKPLKS